MFGLVGIIILVGIVGFVALSARWYCKRECRRSYERGYLDGLNKQLDLNKDEEA